MLYYTWRMSSGGVEIMEGDFEVRSSNMKDDDGDEKPRTVRW